MDNENLKKEIDILRKEMIELKHSRGWKGFMKNLLSKMNIMIGSFIAIIITAVALYAAQITFVPGQPIYSSQVNSNFTELYTEIGNMQGIIVMWSGTIGNIPAGWALCDGSNGTPDLRDRFIVGAGNSYAVGAAGGASMVTLTINQMPGHNHSINDPGHSHTYTSFITKDYGNQNDNSVARTETTLNTGSAVTGITINSAGGNLAHENRPPYYSLAYIMKL